MKKAQAALVASLLAPAVALAFETVDSLPWPSSGRFPAYPADPARPTDIWIQGGMMRDDNILRLESGGRSDTVTRVGAGFSHSQRVIGRQTVRLDARADYYDFQEFQRLDHFAYSGLADWRWEVGNNLSGSIAAGRERRIADLSETQSATRSMVTATRLSATGGYLVTPSVRLRAGVSRTLAERTERTDPETRATSVTAAAEYVTPLRTALGVEARRTDGEAPIAEAVAVLGPVDNDFREREVAFVASYAPGAFLRGDVRVGRTTRRYTELPNRDFEGTTWRVRGEWLPGNKTSLALALYREPRSIIDVAAGHVVVEGISFGPSWAATNKLVFAARLIREDRTFEGDPALAVPGTPLRDENTRTLRFGVGWEPQRHWEAGFAIDRGERESNISGRDYKFTALTGNLAWRW